MLNVFWDYDGTLMDTYPVMVRALVSLSGECGLEMGEEEALGLLKQSLDEALAYLADRCSRDTETLLRRFRELEREGTGRWQPLPGIPEEMTKLHTLGARQFLFTHRDREAIRGLARAGLDRYLTDAVTAEAGFPRKPDPAGLLYLMDRHGIKRGDRHSVMVGDRPLDVLSGRGAGIHGILLDTEHRFSAPAGSLHAGNMEELDQLLWNLL